MRTLLALAVILSFTSYRAQSDFNSSLTFTSDLENFETLSAFKESLKGVEIIALGENTHGLGAVFKAKADLVKYLHQELGFDLVLFETGYGDTVNTASRMESSGEVDKVNISNATYDLLKNDSDFSFTARGKIEAKGKGELEMYFVEKVESPTN